MPIRQGGSEAKKVSTSRRRNCLRTTTAPCSSTPWAWNTFFARSRPILVTGMAFPFDDDAPYHTDPALRERRASTPFQLCRPLDGMRAEPVAVGLFRTSDGEQSMKSGSVQPIVRPTPEFATSPFAEAG